ncbi:MAG: TrbG/VirB9 family P-type conjugative transfer protein [Sphingomonadales bacterium]|nr:TrbG/VirB9 family P-type conjugative transfer protein [Sphingomonadales bacterium]
MALLLIFVPGAAAAQYAPVDTSNSSTQTVRYAPGITVPLAIPSSQPLTLVLAPDDPIRNVQLTDSEAFRIDVFSATNSLIITPLRDGTMSVMTVITDSRGYRFEMMTVDDGAAASLIKFSYEAPYQPIAVNVPEPDAPLWAYRLKGDRSVRPTAIADDGQRTYVEYAPAQSLPAVFAIGPTGNEEVVDGYMREGIFVIDRVHSKLVFRIDKEKATAIRQERRE